MDDDVGAERKRLLEVRRRKGVVDDDDGAGLVRLSVGLESAEDLVEDLERALVRSAAAAGT